MIKPDYNGQHKLHKPAGLDTGIVRMVVQGGTWQTYFDYTAEEVDAFIAQLQRAKEDAAFLKARREAINAATKEAEQRVRAQFGR